MDGRFGPLRLQTGPPKGPIDYGLVLAYRLPATGYRYYFNLFINEFLFICLKT